ncbi:hypothetical protein [Halorubrum sp. Boch-26]|uniref:hypothetical protein n=1 Tax=Halorubrum sp. Boch-26 TaxID=2994426 RepID=UPI002469B9AF|nr:hypothetical protein [Halorubrum sp. Boch-26]
MSDDDIQKYSKEWIRENWDYEQDTGSPLVQLVKVVHELHIAIPGIVAATVVCPILWYYEMSTLQIVSTGLGTIGGGYALFFNQWWCATLSDPNDD